MFANDNASASSSNINNGGNVDDDDSDIPDHFICPISCEIMKDPVVAQDGFTYERAYIEQWFNTRGAKSPMTNKNIGTKHLTPNRTLKSAIIDFLEKRPLYKREKKRKEEEDKSIQLALQIIEGQFRGKVSASEGGGGQITASASSAAVQKKTCEFTTATGTPYTYEGELKNGKPNGRGVALYHGEYEGDKYDGEWKDGKKHGHGVHTWANGSKYDGEWKDGKRHGHGVKTWADGEKCSDPQVLSVLKRRY